MRIRAALVIAGLAALMGAATALAAGPPTHRNTTIALGDTLTQTTTATGSSYYCDPRYVYNEVGYKWKAPENQAVEADTFGSNFDTVLCVIDRSKGTNTIVGVNDDAPGNTFTFQSYVAFNATAGHVYYLVAGGYNDISVGDLQIHLDVTS